MASSSTTYTVNGKPASQQEYEAARENARQNGGIKNWYDNPDLQYYTKAWDAYGGAPNTQPKGSEDGSQAWKNQSRARKYPTADMQNPVQIDGWWYDKPIPKAKNPSQNPYQNQAPNLSGGQASVPTVAQRMSRMGEAVQKGVDKGSMKASQLDRYRQQPSAPASPLINQLQGSQDYYSSAKNAQQTGNTYNQGYPTGQLVNYSAPKPVPMPQGKSRGSYSPASRPQQAYNQGYPTGQLVNYSAPKPVPMPQGKSRGS